MYQCVYFKPSEFVNCTPSCKYEDMNETLLAMLDNLRAEYGRPIVLNSAYRSQAYEMSKNRAGTSSHCEGIAVDISCIVPTLRLQLVKAAINVGFNRIGIGATFIHLDIGDIVHGARKRNPAIWIY